MDTGGMIPFFLISLKDMNVTSGRIVRYLSGLPDFPYLPGKVSTFLPVFL